MALGVGSANKDKQKQSNGERPVEGEKPGGFERRKEKTNQLRRQVQRQESRKTLGPGARALAKKSA